ncbi:MAG: beta-eliminating lyase-related protein, partial [Chloroflexota bacterium]
PVGSLLCGSSAFIARALRWRKVLGGGMRQAGILAAAGIYALEHNVARLADDHANARTLAEGLANLPGIETDPAAVQSNIVFFDIAGAGLPSHAFLQRLTSLGVRLAGSGNSVRAVTSSEVTAQDIDYALVAIRRVVGDAVPVAAG